MSESTDTKSFYDPYQKKTRHFERYDKMIIVSFKPADGDDVVTQIDSKDSARVTRMTSKRKFKGHKKGTTVEALDLDADDLVQLDVNYHYGFARVEVLKLNKVQDDMNELKNQGIIKGWMFARLEKFGDKAKSISYWIPGTVALKLADIPTLVPSTFFTNNSIGGFVAKATERVYISELPTNIAGETDVAKVLNTVTKFNGTDPKEQGFKEGDSNVEYSEPRQCSFHDMLSPLPDPLDSAYVNQWALKNDTGANKGCNVKGAWGINYVNPGDEMLGHNRVIVAVIDTGCDLNHQDFSNSIYPADGTWNPSVTSFHPSSPGADEYSSTSHGTNVSAIIGAKTSYAPNSGNPSLGIAGIAPSCKIMPVKVDLDAGTADDRADAITFVKDRAVALNGNPKRIVANLSWKFSSDSILIRNAINSALANNVLIVSAAGDAANGSTAGVDVGDWNANTDVIWPASYQNVIVAVAMLKNATKKLDSNFKFNDAIFAPGIDVRTYNNNSNTTYAKEKSSIAAAVVSGIAALAWSYYYQNHNNFGMTSATLRQKLKTINNPPGTLGALKAVANNAHCIGRIDALFALQAV